MPRRPLAPTLAIAHPPFDAVAFAQGRVREIRYRAADARRELVALEAAVRVAMRAHGWIPGGTAGPCGAIGCALCRAFALVDAAAKRSKAR